MGRLLKNVHLLRLPYPSPFNVPPKKYASRHRISGALHLNIFGQPAKKIL